jgi:PAS domain-containing protein
MMDDTETYEAARALSEVNAQLKLAADLGKIGSWRRDLRTGRMHSATSRSSCSAWRRVPKACRRCGASLIHPTTPLVRHLSEQVLATNQPVDTEARYRRADGSWRYLLSRRVVERNQAGEAIAYVGVSLDTTERVKHLRHARSWRAGSTPHRAPPASASGRRPSIRKARTGTRRCSSCSTA